MDAISPLPPLSLYVHMPWCVRKCPYCDFNSHALTGTLPADRYLDALLGDLEYALAESGDRLVETVFFGGGTPSLFPAEKIGRVLERLRSGGRLAPSAEITLEANPGTVERHSFAELAAAGVTRISLGAQSFDRALLRALGRIHGPAETRRAAEELHAAGLSNFNIDLMFALPGQQAEGALADIAAALALAPAHISHYQLTIEPLTAFHRHPPVLPADDLAWAMQSSCQSALADAGFRQYEVSAFASKGRQCRHNLNYWEYGDYLGIGAGAHGKLSSGNGTITRLRKRSHPSRYMREAGTDQALAERAVIGPDERVFEFMLNALRLRDGFHLSLFEGRTGLSSAAVLPTLALAGERGLAVEAAQTWRASEVGWRFLNDLQALFLPEGLAA